MLERNENNIAKFLIIIGIVTALIGLLLILKQKNPVLRNLGHLPGDILIKKENFQFYFPITTSIILSVIISLIFLIKK